MPAILPSVPNIRSVNGANALIQIQVAGGSPKTVGYATGVSITEQILVNRIDVLGQIDTRDIEPIARTVSGTIGLMRMTPMADANSQGGGAAYHGVLPQHGQDATDEARTQDVMQFYNNGFDLIIVDSTNFSPDAEAKTRYKVKGCRPTSHSFALSRGSIMGVNITFEALSLTEDDANSPSPAIARV